MKVAIVGATGQTGGSIVDGLLKSDPSVEITALLRASSIEKPPAQDLKKRGVNVVSADLQGPQDELVKILIGIDVVISAIYYQALDQEKQLAEASLTAGVKRYVPCFFATVGPRGVMHLRDTKEGILDHIQQLHLPYTAIDVGWWYQIALPSVSSGRLDYGIMAPSNSILGGGEVPSALVDLRDIGNYVARIIADPQTLNKKVFAYTEEKTQNQIAEIVERLSGETPARTPFPTEALREKCREAAESGTVDQMRSMMEYWNSWGVRGDNTEKNARYLGYVVAHDLYPELKGRSLETFVQEILDGKAPKVIHPEISK